MLRPDRPPEGEPRRLSEGETETELNQAMQDRAKGVGLVMRRPRWNPNTELAHQATVYAKQVGLDDQFHHAAAGALWERGANLGELSVIREIAEGVGLDMSVLGPNLESGLYRDVVLEQYEDAKAKGVEGTPTYMIGGELLKGDVSIDGLRSAIQAAGSV